MSLLHSFLPEEDRANFPALTGGRNKCPLCFKSDRQTPSRVPDRRRREEEKRRRGLPRRFPRRTASVTTLRTRRGGNFTSDATLLTEPASAHVRE